MWFVEPERAPARSALEALTGPRPEWGASVALRILERPLLGCGPGGSARVRKTVSARTATHAHRLTASTRRSGSRKHRWRQRFGTWSGTRFRRAPGDHLGPSGRNNLTAQGLNAQGLSARDLTTQRLTAL